MRKPRTTNSIRENTKYNVKVDKTDGAESIYYVAALSSGGAEKACLAEINYADAALADMGWPESVSKPDLVSDGLKREVLTMATWCIDSE